MSLTQRLTAFFLTALGCVLLGFSLAVFLLARSTLHQQLEERLHAALNTLIASAEVEDGEIEGVAAATVARKESRSTVRGCRHRLRSQEERPGRG